MIKKIRNKLQSFDEFKTTIFLFLPLLLANITYSTSSFCASLMITHLGTESLAAYALSYTTFFALFSFFYGLLVSISILVGENFGKQNHTTIQLTLIQGTLLTVLCSIPFFCIIWYVPNFFPLIIQNNLIIELATRCIRALAWSIFPLLLLIALEQFLIGLSAAKIVLWISILKFPVEIFLNYIFVFGKYGVPAYGVEGIGYGFTITFLLTDVSIVIYLILTTPYSILPSKAQIYSSHIKELIKIGLPIALTYAVETLIFLFTTLLVAKFGANAIVGQQITKQYAELTIIIASALSQAVTVRVSQEMGRANLLAIRKLVTNSMISSLLVMVFIAIIYTFFADFIISLNINITDPNNKEILKITTRLFFLTGIFQVFESLRLVALGALRGLKDNTQPLYISLFTFWIIGFPLSYILGFTLQLGSSGVIYGLLIAVITGSAALIYRLVQTMQKLENNDSNIN